MQLWLIRHGETALNRAGVYQGGALDPPLSKTGRAQAAAMAQGLGPALKARQHVFLYASPQRRAQQTAAPLAALLGQAPQPLDWLRELRYGHWEGLTLKEIEPRFGDQLAMWRTRPSQVHFAGGESLRCLRQRTRSGLGALLKAHQPGDTLVLVAHSGTLRIMAMDLLGMPLDTFRQLRVDNTHVVRFVKQQGKWSLDAFNLSPAGLV